MADIVTVDTAVFTRCSRLVEDAAAATAHWTKLREQIREARCGVEQDGGRALGSGEEDPAVTEKIERYAVKVASLEAKNEELEKRNEELERALAKSEAAVADEDSDIAAERAKLEKERANIRKDAEKLREYNRTLERAKLTLEKRESEVRTREREIENTVDYFAVHLAPTEQKARPDRAVEREIVPLPSIAREPSSLPMPVATSSLRRWKRSRARASQVPSHSDGEQESEVKPKKSRKH